MRIHLDSISIVGRSSTLLFLSLIQRWTVTRITHRKIGVKLIPLVFCPKREPLSFSNKELYKLKKEAHLIDFGCFRLINAL